MNLESVWATRTLELFGSLLPSSLEGVSSWLRVALPNATSCNSIRQGEDLSSTCPSSGLALVFTHLSSSSPGLSLDVLCDLLSSLFQAPSPPKEQAHGPSAGPWWEVPATLPLLPGLGEGVGPLVRGCLGICG